jgi:hypothetical protein
MWRKGIWNGENKPLEHYGVDRYGEVKCFDFNRLLAEPYVDFKRIVRIYNKNAMLALNGINPDFVRYFVPFVLTEDSDEMRDNWRKDLKASRPLSRDVLDRLQPAAEPVYMAPITHRLLGPEYIAHDMAVKRVVNPMDRDLVAVYGASGSDIANFLLSTNATEAYFVDNTEIDVRLLRQAMGGWDELNGATVYNLYKFRFGYDYVSAGTTEQIEKKIICDLKGLDVDRNSIVIEQEKGKNKPIVITFYWQYPGAQKKKYTITFIKDDITNIGNPQASALLKSVLPEQIDLYYQRAGLFTASNYKKFLPQLAFRIREGGFLVTDDIDALQYREYNPDDILSEIDEVRFTKKDELSSPELKATIAKIRMMRKEESPNSLEGWFDYGCNVQIRQRLPLDTLPPTVTGDPNSRQPTFVGPADTKGGIDFRGLPIVTQPMSLSGTVLVPNLRDSPLRGQSLSGAVPELDQEMLQIQNMINAGIMPSIERIKDYLSSACDNGHFESDMEKVLSCVADIFRLEEEKCSSTDSALREMLVLLESDKSAQEIKLALAKLQVSPKEPKPPEP